MLLAAEPFYDDESLMVLGQLFMQKHFHMKMVLNHADVDKWHQRFVYRL